MAKFTNSEAAAFFGADTDTEVGGGPDLSEPGGFTDPGAQSFFQSETDDGGGRSIGQHLGDLGA